MECVLRKVWLWLVLLALGAGPLQGSDAVYRTVYSFGETNGFPRDLKGGVVLDDGTFYGCSAKGGTYNVGTIYKVGPTGEVTTLQVFGTGTDFESNINPETLTRLGSDLYGSFQGSPAIFKIDMAGQHLQMLPIVGNHGTKFFQADSMIYSASDNCFYGCAFIDSDNVWGTEEIIYRFKLDSHRVEIVARSYSYSQVHDFTAPVDGLDGYLYYANTRTAAVYRVSKEKDHIKKLFQLPELRTRGRRPYLYSNIQIVGNKIYGVAESNSGGAFIFSVKRDGDGYTRLIDVAPYSSLVLGPNNKLWGVNVQDSNNLYSFDTLSSSIIYYNFFGSNTRLQIKAVSAGYVMLGIAGYYVDQAAEHLARFNVTTELGEEFLQAGSPVVCNPRSAPRLLAQAVGTNSMLVGMASSGSVSDYGAIVGVITNASVVLSPLTNNFTGLDLLENITINHALTDGKDGYLYGVNSNGGTNSGGYIYRVSTTNQAVQKIINFVAISDNDYFDTGFKSPSSPLVLATNGFIYGLLRFGRTVEENYNDDSGALFRANRDGTGLMIVKEFTRKGTHCTHPGDALIDGGDGFLYGFADNSYNYFYNQECVFRVRYDGSDFKVIYKLPKAEAYSRRASLAALDSSSLLVSYSDDFKGKSGQMLKISREGVVIKTLVDTTVEPKMGEGLQPFSGPLVDAGDGFLYGSCSFGVTRISKNGKFLEPLFDFKKAHVGMTMLTVPGLTLGSDGRLYGARPFAGKFGCGEYFAVTPPQAPTWPTNAVFVLTQKSQKGLYLGALTNQAGATVVSQLMVKLDQIVPGGRVVGTAPLLSANANDLVVQSGSKVYVFNARQSYAVPELKFTLDAKYRVVASGRHPTLGPGLFVESKKSWSFVAITNTGEVKLLTARSAVVGAVEGVKAFGSRPNLVSTNGSDLLLVKGKKVYALAAPDYFSASLVATLPQVGQRPLCYVPYGVSNAPVLLSFLGRRLFLGASETPHATLPAKQVPVGPR